MPVKPVLLSFAFDGFRDLPSHVDNVVASDIQTDSHGNSWRLHLYPGGCRDAIEDGMVALILINVGGEDVNCKFTLVLRNNLGYAVRNETDNAFHLFLANGREGWGFGYGDTKFISRERILDEKNDVLIGGNSLHIDVSIEVKPQKKELYYPPMLLAYKMLALLESEQDADVSFRVEGKILKAHLAILRANAPFLANLFRDEQGRKGSDVSPEIVHDRLVSRRHSDAHDCDVSSNKKSQEHSLVINGITTNVFQLLLRYVYAGAEPEDQTMIELAKELIEASHRFEIFGLKMLVENALIGGCAINLKNVIDYLLLAEANDCALLKEYSMNYLVLHVEDVLSSKQSRKLQGAPDLMSEVLRAVAKRGDAKKTQLSPIRLMSVSELRKELACQGLDVYGSREVLISRMEGSS